MAYETKSTPPEYYAAVHDLDWMLEQFWGDNARRCELTGSLDTRWWPRAETYNHSKQQVTLLLCPASPVVAVVRAVPDTQDQYRLIAQRTIIDETGAHRFNRPNVSLASWTLTSPKDLTDLLTFNDILTFTEARVVDWNRLPRGVTGYSEGLVGFIDHDPESSNSPYHYIPGDELRIDTARLAQEMASAIETLGPPPLPTR